MKRIRKRNDAIIAYTRRQDNIAEYIQRIQRKLVAGAGQTKIDWGDVGSLECVEELLRQADEFLS